MTNLAGIVVLLKLVLTLLNTPGAAQNVQIQTLASQAIQSATQALAVPLGGGIIVPIIPVPIPVVPEPSPTSVVMPSCTLTSEPSSIPNIVTLSWTVTDLRSSVIGMLYAADGTTLLGSLRVQDSGPFPGQMKTNVHASPRGFKADFEGTACSVE